MNSPTPSQVVELSGLIKIHIFNNHKFTKFDFDFFYLFNEIFYPSNDQQQTSKSKRIEKMSDGDEIETLPPLGTANKGKLAT